MAPTINKPVEQYKKRLADIIESTESIQKEDTTNYLCNFANNYKTDGINLSKITLKELKLLSNDCGIKFNIDPMPNDIKYMDLIIAESKIKDKVNRDPEYTPSGEECKLYMDAIRVKNQLKLLEHKIRLDECSCQLYNSLKFLLRNHKKYQDR